ncbi:MAG: hypothetical protein AB7Q29_19330 [Vicinamibacterales bacterium]
MSLRSCSSGTQRCVLTLLLALLLLLGALRPRAAEPGLTQVARLSAAYDAILRAQFDEARARIEDACPPAPQPACDALRATNLWWEIQQDIDDRRLDAAFEQASERAVAAARAWTRREPQRAEAWFYFAGAHGPLSQWRVFRGERLAAARDGKTIKDALERAVALDPALQDAYFGIGLYHYYADVAPAAVRLLRMLLLLPGGDREQGLAEMLRTRERGELLKGEADYQLHFIYLWYEKQPQRALDLLGSLDARYPSNPVFLRRTADIQHQHLGDHRASARAWQTMLTRADAGRVTAPAATAARARVGLAIELIDMGEATRAIDLVAPVDRDAPASPYDIAARASLAIGDAYATIGDVDRASNAYARAIARASRDDPDEIRARARRALAAMKRKR